MIVEACKAIHPGYTPSSMDLKSYFGVLDRNKDGVVDY
jgi:hypothetical protein